MSNPKDDIRSWGELANGMNRLIWHMLLQATRDAEVLGRNQGLPGTHQKTEGHIAMQRRRLSRFADSWRFAVWCDGVNIDPDCVEKGLNEIANGQKKVDIYRADKKR